jgi:predicted lipid-binding transport protein (Tim44 family)
METKEELISNIKEWVKLDNEISQFKKQIKERNEKKKKLTENLIVTMKKNQIDCFDINGGAILYKQNKVKSTINGKGLLAILKNYYKDNETIAEDVTKYVMDNREEKIKDSIKRKIDK